MAEVVGIAADKIDGGFEVAVRLFVPANEEMDGPVPVDLAGVIESLKEGAGEASSGEDEAPKRRRGRPNKAEMGAKADDGGEEEAPKRRRGRPSKAEAEEEAEAGGRRRRRRRAADADEGLSDSDVVKAASSYAEKLGAETVMAILADDFDCENVQDLPKHKREAFVGMLAFEAGEREDAPEIPE